MLFNATDIIIPFACAFAGAYFAYKFNMNSENKKQDEKNFKQFNILLNQVNVVWIALLNYKIVYLSKIEKLLCENPQNAVQETIYPPNISFKANIEQNTFLAKYNFQFLLLLSEIEKQIFLTQESINLCQEHYADNRNIYRANGSLTEQTIKYGIETFELTKVYIDKSISYLLLLREKLLKCKSLYFNFLYLDDRDIFINHNFDSFVPNINQFPEVINLSGIIENSWTKSLNILDYLKLFNKKLLFKVNSFLYFIGLKNK